MEPKPRSINRGNKMRVVRIRFRENQKITIHEMRREKKKTIYRKRAGMCKALKREGFQKKNGTNAVFIIKITKSEQKRVMMDDSLV